MLIYLGADHRGFNLKKSVSDFLRNKGYEVVDLGNQNYDENDDYVDFAGEVAKKISADSENRRGILICGSGVGVDIAANKFRGVRSALGISADQVYEARRDDDVNILSIAADFTAESDAQKIIETFLETPFREEEKYRRRRDKLTQLEENLP
ncbi:MAG: RpiB/LacA/LacB family sugar-phosphate isomerase [Patescibacteria group bacterium]